MDIYRGPTLVGTPSFNIYIYMSHLETNIKKFDTERGFMPGLGVSDQLDINGIKRDEYTSA